MAELLRLTKEARSEFNFTTYELEANVFFLSLQVLHATHPQRVFGTGVQGILGFGHFIIGQRLTDGVIRDGRSSAGP